MGKCRIYDMETDIEYIVSCPYCEVDNEIVIDDFEEDVVNGGEDTEYYCNKCESTFYGSELDVEALEQTNTED